MRTDAEQVLCRVQLSSGSRHGLLPRFEWIVRTARDEGLRGATVLKGSFGLSSGGAILDEHTWSLAGPPDGLGTPDPSAGARRT